MTSIRISTVDIGQRLDEDKKRLIRTLGCVAAGFHVVGMVGGPFIPEQRFVPWLKGGMDLAIGVGLICAGATLKRERGFEKAEEILVRENFAGEMATSLYVQSQLQTRAAQAVIEGRYSQQGVALPPAPAPSAIPQQEARYSEPVSVGPAASPTPENYQWEYGTNEDKTELFDWGLFNSQPEKFPHIFIVGGTGDGKSFTAESLAALLDGYTIVSHPHRKPSDFVNFPVYCAGRNYGDYSKDKPADFAALVTGNDANGEPINPMAMSCASVIKSLVAEMDRRFKLYGLGNEEYPMVNVILDETNTMIAVLQKTTKRNQIGVVDDFVSLVREARKVKIRLFCLVQGTEVKSLGLDGQGAIRNSFRFVRLGDFARDHAARIPGSVAEWVNGQRYPMLVEEEPAAIPAHIVQRVQESINQKRTIEPAEIIEADTEPTLNPLEWECVSYPDKLRFLPPHRPGIYAVYAGSKLLYIGESTNLWERWNSIRYPHHIRPQLDQCTSVTIRFYTTDDLSDKERKDLETRLQIELSPAWNGQKREVPAAEEPNATLEDLLALVLEFVNEKGEATVREVMRCYAIGQKHKLTAAAIDGMFRELEKRGEGRRTEAEIQGKTQVKFIAKGEQNG